MCIQLYLQAPPSPFEASDLRERERERATKTKQHKRESGRVQIRGSASGDVVTHSRVQFHTDLGRYGRTGTRAGNFGGPFMPSRTTKREKEEKEGEEGESRERESREAEGDRETKTRFLKNLLKRRGGGGGMHAKSTMQAPLLLAL